MWIYDKTGRRVNASVEDGRAMVEHCEHSALYPKGTAEQEAAELERLAKADLALIPEKAPDDAGKEEVHAQRVLHESQQSQPE